MIQQNPQQINKLFNISRTGVNLKGTNILLFDTHLVQLHQPTLLTKNKTYHKLSKLSQTRLNKLSQWHRFSNVLDQSMTMVQIVLTNYLRRSRGKNQISLSRLTVSVIIRQTLQGFLKRTRGNFPLASSLNHLVLKKNKTKKQICFMQR